MTDTTLVMEPIARLTRDLRISARTLGDDEARFLVSAYYSMQDQRKRTESQLRSLTDRGQPNAVVEWLSAQFDGLEGQVKNALDAYTNAHTMGSYMRSIYGIGPVISAGLLANIDINRAPTVGHIWSFGGIHGGEGSILWVSSKVAQSIASSALVSGAKLAPRDLIPIARELGGDPKYLARRVYTVVTGENKPYMGLEKQVSEEEFVNLVLKDVSFSKKDIIMALTKRPYSADFKTLLWKVGQSFCKFHNQPKCYYGHVYAERKKLEVERNEALLFKDQAEKSLPHFGPTTDAHSWYKKGMLPPARLELRAQRYAVKLFLSHLHGEWYRRVFKREPPNPYPIAILGHAHFIPAPGTEPTAE